MSNGAERGYVPSWRDNSSRMAQLSSELMAGGSFDVTVTTVLDRALRLLLDADHASLTLSRRKKWETLGATSAVAEEADHLQYAIDEGPCLQAAVMPEGFVRSSHVGRDPRWPEWGPKAHGLGVRGMLCVHLSARDSVGALNLYSEATDSFSDPDEVALALTYAVYAANALATARQVEGLRTALDSRHVIGIAQGVLMATYDLTPERSFELLVRYSSQLNTKLIRVAEHVAQHGALPPHPKDAAPHAAPDAVSDAPD